MSRTVHTLWATRKSIDAGFHPPELLEAWDEWSVDENPEGWQEACNFALTAMGNDLAAHRYIEVKLNGDSLDHAFWPAEIEGKVVG